MAVGRAGGGSSCVVVLQSNLVIIHLRDQSTQNS